MTQEQHQELRNRFNPEGSVLRRQQLRMLEILDAVDACCRKHNIPYWLDSGTLLGAARHKGFIPWDDDLDIMMLRKDYLRLLEILPAELPQDLILQSIDTDPYYTFPFAKVRDLKSSLKEIKPYDRFFTYTGIYIDIFPIEKTPLFWAKTGRRFSWKVDYLLRKTTVDENRLRRKVFRLSRFNYRVVFPVIRFLIGIWPIKTYRISYGTGFMIPRYPQKMFPLSEMEFEGKKYPVPADTDKYLQSLYGDWRQVPDMDKIATHVARLEFY